MAPPTHCPSRGNRRPGKKDQEDPYAEKEREEAVLGKVYGLEGGREFLNPNTLESEGNTLPSSNRVPSTYDLPPGPSRGDQDGEGDEFAPYGAHEASLVDGRGPLPTPQPYGCRAGTERYTEEEEEEEEEEEDWRTQKRRRDQLSRQQKWEMAEWLMDQFNRGLKPPHMEAHQPETENLFSETENLFSDNENLPPEHEEICSDAEETPTRQEAAVTPIQRLRFLSVPSIALIVHI